jgi:hyperosmotically inducible periplasmic protein
MAGPIRAAYAARADIVSGRRDDRTECVRMSDLKTRIMTALAHNAHVHPDEIAVETVDGTDVRLRGTVGSPLQEAQAVETVRDVPGVRDVKSELSVHVMGIDGRADAATEAAILDTLIRSGDIPMEDLGVEADAATVTLRGEVATEAQRERAEQLAYEIPPVSRVWNRLRVRG